MNSKTFIFGNGQTARELAMELSGEGIPIAIACRNENAGKSMTDYFQEKNNGLIEVLSGAVLESCTGAAGDFTLELFAGAVRTKRHATAILLAEETVRVPNSALYGLEMGPFVIPLSRLRLLLDQPLGERDDLSLVKTCVFLNGLIGESHPVISREVMDAALALNRHFRVQASIFTNNLKVAGDGLEVLFRETREAGVMYVKLSSADRLAIKIADNGSMILSYFDEITRLTLTLLADRIVVDETITPSPYLKILAGIMGIELNSSGFAQGDNVHRLPVQTNRRGILTVGPSRAVLSTPELGAEIGAAVLKRCAQDSERTSEEGRALIHTGRCIRCLTCFRACPYKAIVLTPRPLVETKSCEGCAICVTECPRSAIDLIDCGGKSAGMMRIETAVSSQSGWFPIIRVFCCRRSAAPAGELAVQLGLPFPEHLDIVEVPCGGGVSPEQLLSALQGGVDGVMVMTCHEENCHSERGNILARQRVYQLTDFFQKIGFESRRLMFRTIASNMGSEFAEMVGSFSAILSEFGPSRLKK